jgi:Ca2+-transporting ATPase
MAVEDTWLPDPDAEQHQLLLLAASLCSNARLEQDSGASEPWRASGDPTETALLLAAAGAGLIHGDLQRRLPRRRELPFDSHRRRMTVVIEQRETINNLPRPQGERLAITKGAPLELLQRCRCWLTASGPAPLSETMRQEAIAANNALAARGFRVIAVALRGGGSELLELEPDQLETDLVLVGLIGLSTTRRGRR